MKKEKRPVKIVSDEKDFSAVLDIITTHRSRALMSINVESLLTYWEIGAFLSPRIHSGSWSTAVVGRLADYIKRNKPELRGYGKSNLYNMALLYDTFSSDAFLGVLERHKSALAKRINFVQMPSGKSLGGASDKSKRALAAVRGAVGGEDFHSDLLFYHRGLQCLVAFELKTRKFKPSDLGQLEFYLEALDRDVKKENENPSIGIILCRDANRIVVEYAMSRAMSPVMVAQYKRLLIPKDVLQRTFEEYLELPSSTEPEKDE